MKQFRLTLCALAWASVACGGGDSGTGVQNPPPGTPGSGSVSVQNNSFSPMNVTVATGATVTWTWNSGGNPHNVSFSPGGPTMPPNSVTQGNGTHSVMFTMAGTYSYTCTLHSGMDGTVMVTP